MLPISSQQPLNRAAHQSPHWSTLFLVAASILSGCGSTGLDLGEDLLATQPGSNSSADGPDAATTLMPTLACINTDAEQVECSPGEMPRLNSLCVTDDGLVRCTVALPSNAQLEMIDDGEHTAPDSASAPGSSFFWKYGIGNWSAFTYPQPASPSVSPNHLVSDAPSEDLTPPRGASIKAYHLHIEPPNVGNLVIQLDHPEQRAIDLSKYAGITFFARTEGGVDLGFNSVETGSSASGGEPGFGPIGPFFSLPGFGDWQRYVLSFDSASFETVRSSVRTIAFATKDALFKPVDLWVDDVALICDGQCP